MKTNIIIKYFLILILSLNYQNVLCQTNIKLNNNLKPIIHLFSESSYSIEEDYYNNKINRAHIGFTYKFNNKWFAKIIIDRGKPSKSKGSTITKLNGEQVNIDTKINEGATYTMFLKFASLTWKPTDNIKIKTGAILQNHYITQEKFWGNRFVCQTFQDLYWKIPSSDLGIIGFWNLNKNLNLDLAITNGEGSRVNQDKYGKIKLAGGATIKTQENFKLRLYYHNKKTGDKNKTTEQMYSVFFGLGEGKKFKIGVEYNYMKNLNYLKNIDSYGYSIFSNYKTSNKSNIFIRFDGIYYENISDEYDNIYLNANRLICGYKYSPVKNLNLSLNYNRYYTSKNHDKSINKIQFNIEYKI
ncbi:MAG: hypothetical protein N4A49_05725 [Marinifilaceae bacterium]|jgi:hypothetical protein|nr:hypothetical protein [Marinifilaceae bacterium]